jgi:hypothetical protein
VLAVYRNLGGSSDVLGFGICMVGTSMSTDEQRNAQRYLFLRDQYNSLESQHGSGKSCYHMLGGVRELKSGAELDAAIDAAIEHARRVAEDIKILMSFYSVTRMEDLVTAQSRHIENLQAKLPDIAHFKPSKVREG